MTRAWLPLAALALATAGCGQKGPLYLPDKNAKIVTSPATTAAPPAATPAPAPAATPKPKTSGQDQDSQPPQSPQLQPQPPQQ